MEVTFVTHSSFVVELEHHVLIFDYFKGKLPEFNHSKKIYFFSSHKHGDHFSKDIFDFCKEWKHVTYILSKDIRLQSTEIGASGFSSELAKHIVRVSKDQTLQFDGLTVETLRSTDAGVAFIIRAEDKMIYHAGDLNWWHWVGAESSWNHQMEMNYRKEIEKIKGRHFDAAFVPVDPRLKEAYYYGIRLFMESTDTDRVFPMHFWGEFEIIKKLYQQMEVKDYVDKIVEIEQEGQHWRY